MAELPELRTERLTLRLARPGMQAAIARFLMQNFEGHLDRWSPPATTAFFTEAFWRDRLGAAVDEYAAGRAVRFVLQPKDAAIDAEVLGTCNYTNIVRGPFLACHLGYQIARSHEGRGLMAEGLRAANAFIFERLRLRQGHGLMHEALAAANDFMFTQRRLHRIMANYRPENYRSARLLQRLGFQREGLAPNYLFIDGAWRDHVLTSLTNPRFDDAWVEAAGR